MAAVDEKVKQIIVEQLGVDEGEVTPSASFVDDLGADSLDTVELVMAFEEAFDIEIPDEDAEKIRTVQDADRLHRQARERREVVGTKGRSYRDRPDLRRGQHRPMKCGRTCWRARVAWRGSRSLTRRSSPARSPPKSRTSTRCNFIEKKEVKKMGRFIHFALAAADEAMKMSRSESHAGECGARRRPHRFRHRRIRHHRARTHRACSKAARARSLLSLFPPRSSTSPPGMFRMRFGAKGPNEATATACTTSAHSIGDSFSIIQHSDADVMIAGGAEAAITPMGVGGFAAMRALSTRNDEPEKASRPWDADRDGFVIGEGAGILILEDTGIRQQPRRPRFSRRSSATACAATPTT